MVIFSGIAVGLNLILLKLFNQKSFYRAEHSLVGVIMLMGFFLTSSEIKSARFKIFLLFLFSLIPCYIGTVFPDLDIKLLGIGGHRNPLFHSGILFFVLLFFSRKFDSVLLTAAIAAFGIGVGSHLFWDIFDHADVRWIPGGTLDRLWIGSNALLCFVLSKYVSK